MMKKDVLTKILAIGGTMLVGFPILAPVLISIIVLAVEQIFRFDYLMPAELFPFALAGGLMLVWAAVRTHTRGKWIGWSLGAAVVMLAGGQGLAVATGLTSGAIEPGGWQWAVVLRLIVLYTLALVALFAGGVLLLRDLFPPQRKIRTKGPEILA